jgi:hypothetical protein
MNISETIKEILKAGDIFSYLYIAESQNSFDSERITTMLLTASEPDALVLMEKFRKYVEGVRLFWRQDKILAYQYPLSHISTSEELPMGIVGYHQNSGSVAFIKSNPEGLTTPTGRFIPPEIMDFEVLKYLELDTRVLQLINDIHRYHHIILRMARSSEDIHAGELAGFARVGGILMLAGKLFNSHPQYPILMHTLTRLGRKFLDFILTASMATGPVAFNPDIDQNSVFAARDCLNHFRNLSLGTENLMTVIENISTSMDQINHAVAGRVQLDRWRCFPAPIAPA